MTMVVATRGISGIGGTDDDTSYMRRLCDDISRECRCDIRKSIIELHLVVSTTAATCHWKQQQQQQLPKSLSDAPSTTTALLLMSAADIAHKLLMVGCRGNDNDDDGHHQHHYHNADKSSSTTLSLQAAIDRCDLYATSAQCRLSEIVSENYIKCPSLSTSIDATALLADEISRWDIDCSNDLYCCCNNDVVCATTVSYIMGRMNTKYRCRDFRHVQKRRFVPPQIKMDVALASSSSSTAGANTVAPPPPSLLLTPPAASCGGCRRCGHWQSRKDTFARINARQYCTFTEFYSEYMPTLRSKFCTAIVAGIDRKSTNRRCDDKTTINVDRISSCVASELTTAHGFAWDDWEELFVKKSSPPASSAAARDFEAQVSLKMRAIAVPPLSVSKKTSNANCFFYPAPLSKK